MTFVRSAWPGLLACAVAATAARFLAEHYGAPAMLMALLLGLALSFLAEEGSRTAPGVNVAARQVLRIGVALLGARISLGLLADLGPTALALVVAAIAATLAFGWAAARVLGRGWRLGVLTAGAVGICGASAAMALAAVLPPTREAERDLSFTVFGVTILSTVAMVLYPALAGALGLSAAQTALFLGGTIHDVAQVVGAGFTVSEATGEASTSVKLVRVAMLAPVVLILTLALRRAGHAAAAGERRAALVPGFVLAFFALATANSLGLVPQAAAGLLWTASSWFLLTAIVAVGAKTDLKRLAAMPAQAVALIVAETVFLALFVLGAVALIA
mgnify:FL=1